MNTFITAYDEEEGMELLEINNNRKKRKKEKSNRQNECKY